MKNHSEVQDILEIVKRVKKISNKFQGKNILLTGGNGFLGKYFQEVINYYNQNIFKKPCKLCIVDIRIDKMYDKKNFVYLKKDILEINKYPFKFDYIIHAAGIPDPSNYYKFPVETLLLSISGTKKLLDLSKKNKSSFTFFSTSEIYGNPTKGNIPTKETYFGNVNPMGDRACYDEGKRVGETLCYIYSQNYNMKNNVIRPFNIVGPGMNKNDNRVFPSFFRNIKNNKKLNIYLKGKQTRSYCYINDAMVCFFYIIFLGKGDAYNVGNPKEEISAKDLVNKIKKTLNIDIRSNFVKYPNNYPKTEPQRRCPDVGKAKKEFSYKPIYNLEKIIKKFYIWSQKNY